MHNQVLKDLPSPPPGRTGWPWGSLTAALPVVMSDGHPWPRVSIVTPSFNQAQFLEETIRSVLCQNYPNLEYFICDGGSADGSAEIIKKYADWLDFWVSEPDRGQSDAINKGWEKATGQIVAYLNSDDLYCPEAIRRAVEFLTAHPDVGIVYGNFSAINASSQVMYPCVVPRPFSLSKLLLFKNLIPQPTAFIRREVLESTGLLDVWRHYTMDYALWVHTAWAGVRFAQLGGPALACMRDWPGNKSNSCLHKSIPEIHFAMKQFYSDERLPPSLRGKLDMAYANVYIQAAYDRYWHDEMRAARGYLWQAVKMYRPILFSPAFLYVLGKTFLGPQGRRLARRLKVFITQPRAD